VAAFIHLRNIPKIRNILSQIDAENLVHPFVTCSLDCCDVIFAGCPNGSTKNFQLIQNAAARALTGTAKRDYISPAWASLHWLLVKFRVIFSSRTLLFTNQALNVVPRIARSRLGGRAFSF